MDFNSPLFLVFLMLVVILNYILPSRYRISLVVFASFVFIGYFSLLSLFAVLFFSLLNFYIAQYIIRGKAYYYGGLAIHMAIMILCNYFAATATTFVFNIVQINFDISARILALGLSFYSLQNIAYLVEVYNQRMQPQVSVSKYVLYNAFFPRLMSGPVMMPQELMLQMKDKKITAAQLAEGFNVFLWGLVKKVVIADRLSPYVNHVFDSDQHYCGFTNMAAAGIFTLQLYFDFSGYSDMAVGAAKMLGYDLIKNFQRPFRSLSIAEFWRRWHISLIRWFTTYIYYPVVYHFRRFSKASVFFGVFATFLISSVWHGIGLTFLLWALCHVFYIYIELVTKRVREKFKKIIPLFLWNTCSVLLVFSAVCLSNIFFRAHDFSQSVQMINSIVSNISTQDYLSGFLAPLAGGGNQQDQFNILLSLSIAATALLFEARIEHAAHKKEWSIVYVSTCVLLLLLLGIFNSGEQFIYMQF